MLKKGSKEKRLEQYWKKEIQSEIYKKKKKTKNARYNWNTIYYQEKHQPLCQC